MLSDGISMQFEVAFCGLVLINFSISPRQRMIRELKPILHLQLSHSHVHIYLHRMQKASLPAVQCPFIHQIPDLIGDILHA